jgi:hypothetical protein
MNDEFKMMWKKQSWHMPGETEENKEKLQSG